jgi:hypothetical protein
MHVKSELDRTIRRDQSAPNDAALLRGASLLIAELDERLRFLCDEIDRALDDEDLRTARRLTGEARSLTCRIPGAPKSPHL